MVVMRDAFLDKLYQIAREDPRVVLLCDDFGAISLDKFRSDLSSQFVHIGIAEQNMVNVATGLALAGKIVYMYAISPFLPLRCFEQIRVNLSFNNLPVTGVGVGAGYAYDCSGPTHHAMEDIAAMRALPGMTILQPSDSLMAGALAEITYRSPGPKYVRFDREEFPLLYETGNCDFADGLAALRAGRDLVIIASGKMVHQAFKVAARLTEHSIDAGIIDLYRLKPVNEGLLLRAIGGSKRIVTMEENLIHGGTGSLIAEVLLDNGKTMPLKRFAIPDQYFFEYGGREELHRLCGLDVDSITERLLEWLR